MSRVDSSNSSEEILCLNPITVDSLNCSPPPNRRSVTNNDAYKTATALLLTSSEMQEKDILESRNATVESFVDSDLTRCVSNEGETEIEENRNSDLCDDTLASTKNRTLGHSNNECKSTNHQIRKMSLKMLSLTNSGKEDLDAFYNSDVVSLSDTPSHHPNVPHAVLSTPLNFVTQLDDSTIDNNVAHMDIPFTSPKPNYLNINSLIFSPLEKLSSKSNSRHRNHFFPPATPNTTASNNRKQLLDKSSIETSQLSKKPKVESSSEVHIRSNSDIITGTDKYTTQTASSTRRKIQIPEQAKKYGTQLSIEIFQHFVITEFKESDRSCKRAKSPIGTYGFACAYCNGRHGKKRGGRCGRYFPSSLKTLADPNKILFCMYRHLQRCEYCPSESKERLDSAFEIYDTERSGQGRGYQKKFYEEVWRDLHRGRLGVDDEFVVEQEETQEDSKVE